MKVHSDKAWAIASKFSGVLGSETRDLAALIDEAYPPAPAPTGDSAGLMDEPTSEMVRKGEDAGRKEIGMQLSQEDGRRFAAAAYRAMAALHQPPQPTGDVGELVERLRDNNGDGMIGGGCQGCFSRVMDEAADFIETANSRLAVATEMIASQNGVVIEIIGERIDAEQALRTARDALRKVANSKEWSPDMGDEIGYSAGTIGFFKRVASAALTGAGEEGE